MRRLRQDLVSVLFHCLKMLPLVRAQDKALLWHDQVQQGLLWGNRKAWEWRHRGCGGPGSTHLRVDELQVQRQLHSIPWHLPFAQPTSNSSRQGQCLHTHPELSQTCLFHGAAQQTAWAPASLELSGPNQEPTAQRALQHQARVVTPEAVPVRFYLSSLQLPCCTHVQPCSSAGSCKAFLTSSQLSLCAPKVCMDGGLGKRSSSYSRCTRHPGLLAAGVQRPG